MEQTTVSRRFSKITIETQIDGGGRRGGFPLESAPRFWCWILQTAVPFRLYWERKNKRGREGRNPENLVAATPVETPRLFRRVIDL